jgi:hypothetical protein
MNKNILRILASVVILSWAAQAPAQDASATLSVGGKPALVLKVPKAAKLVSTNGYLGIHATNLTLHVWAVPNARKAADALERVPEIIKSEFLNFKVTDSLSLDFAGAPARHLIGTGNEADDHDPGKAEVIVFLIGGHVFAACVHGEADDALKALPAMMAVLKTAKAP